MGGPMRRPMGMGGMGGGMRPMGGMSMGGMGGGMGGRMDDDYDMGGNGGGSNMNLAQMQKMKAELENMMANVMDRQGGGGYGGSPMGGRSMGGGSMGGRSMGGGGGYGGSSMGGGSNWRNF